MSHDAVPSGSTKTTPALWVCGTGVFVLAFAVRVAALWLQGRDLIFAKYPGAARMLVDGTLDPARVLDFSPLYLELHRLAYLAGLTNPDVLRIVQCVLGSFSCVLVFWIGRRLFGWVAGAAAGVLAALLRDLVIYDQVFDSEPVLLVLFLGALGLLVCGGSWRRQWIRHAALGILVGLAIATRPTAWLVAPVALLVLVAQQRAQHRSALAGGLLFLALLLAVQGGVAIRHRAHGVTAAMTPWQVFYTGNNPMATGLWRADFLVKDLEAQFLDKSPDYAHQAFREVAIAEGAPATAPDHYWRDLSLSYARHHPLRYLRLLSEKLLALGQPHDPHDAGAVFSLQDRLRVWPLVTASLLVPFGLVGLVLLWRRLWIVGLVVLPQAAVCLFFFVSARYRLPLLPGLAIAAAGLGHLVATALRRPHESCAPRGDRLRVLLRAGLGSLALLAIFHLPLPPGRFEARDTRLTQRSLQLHLEARRQWRDHHLGQAQLLLERCYYLTPWHAQRLPIPAVPFPLAGMARRLAQPALEEARADGGPLPWLRLGLIWDDAKMDELAVKALARAEATSYWPGDRPILFAALIRRGIAELRLGRRGAARAAFARAGDEIPGAPEALVGLAISAEEPERGARLRSARVGTPLLEVLYHEGRMLLDADRPAEALAPLAALVKGLPVYARGHLLYAVALARTGRLHAAVAEALEAHRRFPFLFDATYRPVELLHQAALSAPDDPELWRRLAIFAAFHGDLRRSLEAWGRLERLGLRPVDRSQIGWLYLGHDDPSNAERYFRSALAVAPQLAEAQQGLALARRRLAR
jgi:hypothetical protein